MPRQKLTEASETLPVSDSAQKSENKKISDEEKAARKLEREKKKQAEAEGKKEILEKAEKMAESLGDKEAEKELEEDEKSLDKTEEGKKKKLGKKDEDEKKQTSNTLIPIEDYVKAGCYIGTKVITPDMRKFVYRRRADGIAIINTNIIDQKIGEAAKEIAKYKPQDWVVVCKREAGWRAVKLFSELTGVRVFTKKYPAGIITNTDLPDFFETEMIFVCDPWLDKNAMTDASNVKKRIFAVCDTNNLARDADFIIPANNKSNKSLGVLFYILSREYMKSQGISKKLPDMEDFIGEKLEDLQPKRTKKAIDEKRKDIEKIEGILKLDSEEKNR
ncbi:MAG: 30S ribosomal protein S2 [Nanoarchaeota archaeon]|nr:30S ribosomal protein S2 [Nanoarchaeota archaeon]MBU4086620.1 30S ribosomal protein S2 [Nanoarchaeota archaeon]